MSKHDTVWDYIESLAKREVTSRELADILGLDRPETTRRYKEGISYPNFRMCFLIAKAYDQSPEEVYNEITAIRNRKK